MNVSCLPHSFNSLCHARKSKSGSSCLCFEIWNYPLGIFMFQNLFLDWNVTQHLLIRIQNGYEFSPYGPREFIKEPNHCIIKLHMHGKQSMGFSNHHISWKEKGNTNLWYLWVQSLFPFRYRRCNLNYILCSAYLALHQHRIFCVIHHTEINVPWHSVVLHNDDPLQKRRNSIDKALEWYLIYMKPSIFQWRFKHTWQTN